MHANAVIWALVILLPYSHGQETVNTTATAESTTASTNISDNSSANSTDNSTSNKVNMSDVKNVTDVNSSAFDVNNTIANTIDNNSFMNNATNSSNNSDATTTVIPEPEPRNCTTARYIKGVCVHRRKCDYSTPNIDLTLFAPRWYKKECQPAEVCCPFDAIVEYETANKNEDFDFNDDD